MNDPTQLVELTEGSCVQIGGVRFRIEKVISDQESLALLVARRTNSSSDVRQTSVLPTSDDRFVHIDFDVQPLLWGSAEERCDRFWSCLVSKPPWIIRTSQERIVSALHLMMRRIGDGGEVRLAIVGPQSAGKRSAVKRFLRQRADRVRIGEDAAIPILSICSWESSQQFYEACLDGADFNSADLSKFSKRIGIKNADRRRIALDAMRVAGVRILIVENLFRHNNPTKAHVRKRIEMLDSFVAELDIPLVAIHDSPLNLPGTWPSPWRQSWQHSLELCAFGTEFDKALSAFERRLPLRRPSTINRPDMAGRLYTLSDGNLGVLWRWLAVFAKEAILSANERIDHELMDRVEFGSYDEKELLRRSR